MFDVKAHIISKDSATEGIESSSPFFTVAGEVLAGVIDYTIVNAGALILCDAPSTSQIIQDRTCNAFVRQLIWKNVRSSSLQESWCLRTSIVYSTYDEKSAQFGT